MNQDSVNENQTLRPALSAFEVSVVNTDWARIVNARTSGQAKSWYYRELQDPWPDIPFTALRCRRVGGPQTSEQFRRNAQYRGMPAVECGQRVKCGDAYGYIVGHNSSANFDVLFDNDSRYPGMRLNVHPHEVEVVNEQESDALNLSLPMKETK